MTHVFGGLLGVPGLDLERLVVEIVVELFLRHLLQRPQILEEMLHNNNKHIKTRQTRG